MIRIAYINADPYVPVFGSQGSSVHAQEVIRALRAEGADVTLFMHTQDGYAPPDLVDLKVCEFPRPVAKSQIELEETLLTSNRQLMQALANHGPFDLVYERYSVWGFGGMSFARSNKIPGVLEVNEPLIEIGAATRQLKDVGGARQVTKRAFTDATLLVAISKEIGDYLRARTSEVGKVRVIPNGANPERFKPGLIPALPDRQGVFTVGYAGTLSLRQGLDTLIKAFAILHRRDPRARLLLVGDGPDRETIGKAAASVGIASAVELTGAVSPGIVPRLLASMDVAVAAYPRKEQFYESPLKLFEYMASGLAVVTSSIGQPGEIVTDGQNGLLCPPGDFVALAKAIDSLRVDEALRSRLGHAASAYVRQHCSWRSVAGKVLIATGLKSDSEGRTLTAVGAG
ncbi:MAG TPA: glycosyltransferase family 4 protein [Rhodothermales bacterium]|nr:glycosyltransferase family 4 protein [Rhodothermales bacterium]